MKKIFITISLLLSVLFLKAQLSFEPVNYDISSPEEIQIYKRYTEGKTYIGINGGISIPMADYSKNVEIGLGMGLHLKYFITDHFVFGASFNFYSSNFKDKYIKDLDTLFKTVALLDTTGLVILSTEGKSTLYPFNVNLEYYFSPLKRFKPYVGLGLGFYVINHKIEVNTNKEKPQVFKEAESTFGSRLTSDFGFTPYAGFMVDFNELISMNFDVKYNQIFSTPSAGSLAVNLGLIFNLDFKY